MLCLSWQLSIEAALKAKCRIFCCKELKNYSICSCCLTVHGKEYGFGAHDFPVSGVFEVEPKRCPGFIYRCSISLGRINMPLSEFRIIIEDVASEYHGNTYHLISKNCNHFTDDMSWKLTEKRIPGWVNRLARLGKKHLPTLWISFPYEHALAVTYERETVLFLAVVLFSLTRGYYGCELKPHNVCFSCLLFLLEFQVLYAVVCFLKLFK